ncbi:lysine-specific demethylase REF6 [Carica papaya]|uniref:lysine-specific demethylase REF6 n=1 Tax=Carica papaya TaxID=3649 RepID=UPI000B8CC435|nr:lysine-specific demethylase REF6 [Carica papaya]
MAASTLSSDPTQEVFPWLKSLPLAPEFHPTFAEFQDPIAYIFKIEKEASKYGICKIVPPVPPAPKKSAITNLNRSLAARAASAGAATSKPLPTFTTRQQQIGFCPRKPRPVQKPVWQSGEYYSFPEFEAKAKSFEKTYLKKCGKKGSLSPLEVETLYWKATVDKPFSVEYANDMPGSAFVPVTGKKSVGVGGREAGEGVTVGETAWNMRGVSRAEGSLLRFMKEEIPGVTSPMVYIAMMFSWFAWHVEDHDLHSLNYLHMGAGKTWYGVPRDAAVAFEEVVRVHGYGGEVNPLVTFATLGEKTTVMSPEVFVSAGVPCCRLVQNAGEFVVTFPRAYHSGFSHGFNCGEAANIATPEWLRVAKDAAIRRASINYPPMVSHFQLLYDLALALCSRIPMNVSAKPRSSRLKDKKKGEGETLVKELFVQNVIQNNDLLHFLGKGSSAILLPEGSSDISVCSDLRVGSQLRAHPRMPLGACSYSDVIKSSKGLDSGNDVLGSSDGMKPVKGFYSVKGKFVSICERSMIPSLSENKNIGTLASQSLSKDTERESSVQGDGLSDQRLFSCVTCGILSFACVAVVQPREAAARYLMSADCSFFNDWTVSSGVTSEGFTLASRDTIISEPRSRTRWTEKSSQDGLFDVPVQSVDYQIEMVNQANEGVSDTQMRGETSALGLLASTYGDSSDSDEDHHATEARSPLLLRENSGDETSLRNIDCYEEPGYTRSNFKSRSDQTFDNSEFETDNLTSPRSNSLDSASKELVMASNATSNCSPVSFVAEKTRFSRMIMPVEKADMPYAQKSDEDSSRLHVFCLEHAVEVEKQLRPIGGVHIMLLCHPEYPRIEAEAKLVAEELGIDYLWNDIKFQVATREDKERIQSALDSEEAIPGNGDWAVKLGINLFYSAVLSRSPMYTKQMPYNSVIYSAFGRSSPASSPSKSNSHGRRPAKQRKVVVGKWCGKVWMSNQVHPFLAQRDLEEQEQERSFHARAIADENLENKPENIHKAQTTLETRKYSRKRKTATEIVPMKKIKPIETEPVIPEGSLEDGSYKQHRRVSRSKQTKYVEKEDAVSCDSLEQNTRQWHRRSSRRKLAKTVEREDSLSDDPLEDNSLLKQRRILRGKRVEHFESDDAISIGSLGDNSPLQQRRTLGSKQTTFIEREDAGSDDDLVDDSHHHYQRISRGKETQYVERDFTLSDDSMEDDSLQLDRRGLGNRQTTLTEMEGVVSCDSSEDHSQQQRSRTRRSKETKFVNKEDAGSYDSLEDNSHQQPRKIPRGNQVKFIEREDTVSYDSLEDNCHPQGKRTQRSKKAKDIEREDGVSYDSLEDSSHQRRRRTLRSKKMKPKIIQKVKMETPQHMKKGKHLPAKQQTSRKKKQETPRQQNDKSGQNTRQFSTYVEEQLEGGPSTRLRKRILKSPKEIVVQVKEKKQTGKKKGKNASAGSSNAKVKDEEAEYLCDMEGCTMSFVSKQELVLHKRNICPVKGCGKKFFSHKYLVQHRRVHMDDRPLKCPWKGCKMTFKWAWARTEHIRVHTGARPYVCAEAGCGQTFRFVSDFSRHKRKTGHSAKKARG